MEIRLKRFLSLAMAIVMVIGMMPTNIVFATETEGGESAPSETTCSHNYEKVVTAPDCENGGYTTYTCSACGDNYTADAVDALGHSYAEGACSICGTADPNYVAPHEHTYQYACSTECATCTEGTREATHTYVDGKCECGAADPNYVAPHEHTYQYACSTECSTCTEGTREANHTYVDGKCECGAEEPSEEPSEEPTEDPLVVQVQGMLDALPELPPVVKKAELEAYQAKVNEITAIMVTMTKEQTDQLTGLEKLYPNVTLEETTYVAMIDGQGFGTFAEALTAAAGMSGDVTVEIYDKVTLNTSLSGNYSSIKFIGRDTDAEIYLDVQGYITATGKKVAFEKLTLSKSQGGFITNAGFMNVAFGVYDVVEVSYTKCNFANGAYASSGDVTFTECVFKKSWDKYGLWAYGDANIVVDDCEFDNDRGIKMYAEGAAKVTDLTVKATDFSKLTGKPAIVLTYGESVTLTGNTYSSTGVFELDLDGAPNGTAVTSDVAPTAKNDNGACGVLVDGKIYTTVAQAAGVATSGSTVTLLHDSTETVELLEGVTLNKNGFTAAGITVAKSDETEVTPPVITPGDAADVVQTPAGSEVTPEEAESVVETVIDDVQNNSSITKVTENVPDGAEFVIELKTVVVDKADDEAAAAPTKLVFEVAPMQDGKKVQPEEAITFRLPIPSAWDGEVKVYHDGTPMPDTYEIKGTGNAKYVEISSKEFSVFAVEKYDAPVYVASIDGGEQFENLQDALDAAREQGKEHIFLLADVTEDVVFENSAYSVYLNGYTLTGTFKVSSGVLNLNGDNPGAPSGRVSKIVNTGVDGKYALWCGNATLNLGAITIEATEDNGTAVYCDGSKLNVLGDVVVNGNVETGVYGIIGITNGTFNGSLIEGQDSSLEVVGGKFKNDPSACLPSGYEATLTDGYYVVAAKQISLDDLATDTEGAYLISTPQDVVTFRTLLNTSDGKNILSGKVFKLANDINMTGITLAAAGNDSKRFMGTFDGQNHTISNVSIQAADTAYVAFFGNISGATIKNLTLHNLTVVGGSYTAGLVGFTRNSTITNCAVTGDISITGTSHVGGIHAGGVVSITDCEVNGTGTISGTIDVGAISGLISEGSTTVTGNEVKGVTVSGTGLVGGLIGRAIVGTAGLNVKENSLTDVSVVSSGASYAQNGLAVGSTQAISGAVTYEDNSFTNSTLTVNGVANDTIYCNTNFDGTDYSDNVTVVVPVAKIGDVEYKSLAAAAAEAQPGQTITLLADVSIDSAITIAQGVTLNGGDKTITVNVNHGINLAGKLTNAKVSITKEDAEYNAVYATSGAEIADCTFTGIYNLGDNEVSRGIVVAPGAAVTITGNTFSHLRQPAYINNAATGTVSGNRVDNTRGFVVCCDSNMAITGNSFENNAVDIAIIASETTTDNYSDVNALIANNNGCSVDNQVTKQVAKIGNTLYATVADALNEAKNGDTIKLVSGETVISMAGSVVGGKTVTITGTAIVDWTKGNLFIGRGGEGDGKVIFDGANITSSVKKNPASTGFHVSGSTTDSKVNNGVLVIKNSNIEVDYLINRNEVTVEGNSTLIVYGGCYTHGRNASESASGNAETATLTIEDGATVNVINENGMGVGGESNGVMTVKGTYRADDLSISSIGSVNVDGGVLDIAGATTNNGELTIKNSNLTNATIAGSGTTYFSGDVNFYGNNEVLSGVDGSDFDLIVNKGATLLISRFTMGYNRNITVYGEIENAHEFDPTGKTPSLKFNSTSGVSVGGYGTGNLTVKDAYIELGNSSWKNATGTFDWNFKNSYVSATSFTNNNARGSESAVWNVTFDDSVLAAKNYIKNGVGTTYSFTNGSVATTGSLRIDGEMYIDETSSVTTTGQQNNVVGAVDEHGGINGTVTVDGTLTIGSTSKTQLEMLGGELKIGKSGKVVLGKNSLTIDADSKLVIDGEGHSGGTYTGIEGTVTNNGTIEVINNADVYAAVVDGKIVLKGYVARIDDQGYATFEAALNAVQNGETITLVNGAVGSENKEIEFTKDIEFTITGKAPEYALPIVTFQNATVTIKDAEILIPELDARENATINVIDSTVRDAGGNSIAKSYFNGAINISGNSVVHMMQVTTAGYITISGNAQLNATWQTNAIVNGLITVKDNATLATGALQLTGATLLSGTDYSVRANTDADRVGKPAAIVVDGANLIVGSVKSAGGADYSYNSSQGINIGTIDGKSAVLDIKNGATVNVYMANGETANIGANGTVNVDASTLTVACRAETGKVTLTNNGTVYVTGTSNIAANVTGAGWVYMNGVNLDADTKLHGAKVGFINGTNTIVGSVIDKGWFSVGIGKGEHADAASAFATANGITMGDVTVNVSGDAIIGNSSDAAYSGWVGSAYSADKTQHKYVLNVKNSMAAFGYLHVSKDGALNVNGHATNKYTVDNANVDFYAGNFIINGEATFDGIDAWAKYTKISVDHEGGVLNIVNGTNYEASIHNGATIGDTFTFWGDKVGVVNVENATLEIDNVATINANSELNIKNATLIAKGVFTPNKKVFISGNSVVKIENLDGRVTVLDDTTLTDSYVKSPTNGTTRVLGDLTLKGGFGAAYLMTAGSTTESAGYEGIIAIEDGTTVNVSYGVEFNGNVTLDGGTIKLSGGNASGKFWGCVFQDGTYEINTDIVVESNGSTAPIYFTDANATINSTITQRNSGGEPLYIGTASTVTLGTEAVIDTLSVHGTGKLIIDATGMTAGEYANVKCGASGFTGEIEVINNKILKAELVDGKIVLVGAVAMIGDAPYWTLQEAVDKVEDGQTITLIDDITFTKKTGMVNGEYVDGLVYTGDKSFTVDFDGHTITENGEINDYLIYLKNTGSKDNEITFTNGKIAINSNSTATAWAAITVGANSATHKTTLNLNGMEVVNGNPNNASNQVIRVRNGSTVNLNNGTLVTSNGTSYGVVAETGSTLNINNGAKVVQKNSGTTGGNLVYTAVSGNGIINVNDGAEIVSDNYGIHNLTTGNAVINIKGGTITAPIAVHAATNGGAGQTATVTITGGTFNGTLETYTDAASIKVSGGAFNAPVKTEFCADGYEPCPFGNGIYGVKVEDNEAKIGTKQYKTLALAIADAKDGDTIELLANVTVSTEIEVNKNITIAGSEANGVRTAGAGVFHITGNNSLTLDKAAANFAVYADTTYAGATVNGQTVTGISTKTSNVVSDGKTVTVTNPSWKVEVTGGQFFMSLQDAINAAEDGDTITLLADCAENVTVTQAPDYAITIDGNGKTMSGTITVDGKSGTYLTSSVTIKNVNFDAKNITTDACINLGDGTNATRYTCNVTVEDCSFTGGNRTKAAIKSYTGGDKNLTISGCTVDATMHSLLQVHNVEGLVIDGCEVYSKNGINLNSSANVEIKNSTIDVSGYAVRAGAEKEGSSGKITLTNNTLKTDDSEGDAVIIIRGKAVKQIDLSMEKNVVSGATHISGTTAETTNISANGNYWDGKDAPVVSGTPVEVENYYIDAALTQLGYKTGNEIDMSKFANDASNTIKAGEEIHIDGMSFHLKDDLTVEIPEALAKKSKMFITSYKYGSGEAGNYPTAMYVWLAKGEDANEDKVYETYTVERVSALDNFFLYHGTSIRIDGYSNGIRFISSIDPAIQNALINGNFSGLAGAKMINAGTEFWRTEDNKQRSEVYGGAAGSNFRVFATQQGRNWFTGMLTNLGHSDELIVAAINSHPYAVLQIDGTDVTLYGGVLTRSVYDVAKQNAQEGTSYYDYVTGLIARGDAYQAVNGVG